MDDKTKLYVFARKEAVLILLFFIVASFISFLFGMAVGQNLSFGLTNFTPEEKQIVEELAEENAEKSNVLDLQSGAEEDADKVVQEREDKVDVDPEEINQRLEQEIEKEMSDEPQTTPQKSFEMESSTQEDLQATQPSEATTQKTSEYSGKYTIVVGSYRAEQEAQEFAAGFKARGYQPIINEIEVPDRGKWYRVSLGLFENVTEAKEYMKKEDSLFQGQDSFFYKFE